MQSANSVDDETALIWCYVIKEAGDLVSLLSAPPMKLRLSARQAARGLGMHSSVELERFLRSRELPSFSEFRDWYLVFLLFKRAQATGSLSAIATELGSYPSVLYRFVHRVCGERWSHLLIRTESDVIEMCVLAWVARRRKLSYRAREATSRHWVCPEAS
jgi:hypothetical protein